MRATLLEQPLQDDAHNEDYDQQEQEHSDRKKRNPERDRVLGSLPSNPRAI